MDFFNIIDRDHSLKDPENCSGKLPAPHVDWYVSSTDGQKENLYSFTSNVVFNKFSEYIDHLFAVPHSQRAPSILTSCLCITIDYRYLE